MNRRLVPAILAAALVLALAATPTLAGFRDTAGHWAERGVARLVARGVVNGYADGTFKPENGVTRAEFSKLIIVALGKAGELPALQGVPSSFTDVPNWHWAKGYLELAYELGLIEGDAQGRIYPDRALTRLQTTIMIMRALGYRHPFTDPAPANYKDLGGLSADERSYIGIASKIGIVTGFPDGTFRPQDPVTRAQASVLINRLLDRLGQTFDLVGEFVQAGNGTLSVEIHGYGSYSLGRFSPTVTAREVPLAPNVQVYVDGRAASLASLRRYDEVQVILDKDGKAGYIEVNNLNVAGKIATINAGEESITIATAAGDGRFWLAPAPLVLLNGKRTAISDLTPGDEVYLALSSLSREARIISALRFAVEGTLAAVDATAGRLEVSAAGGAARSYTVGAGTLVALDGVRLALSEVRPGDRVRLAFHGDDLTYVEVSR